MLRGAVQFDAIGIGIPNRPSPASAWERFPVLLWLAIALALSVKAWVEPFEHTTYPCFEAGSRCWWADRDMYDVTDCGHEYRYSPTFAVVFSSFAMLPTTWGGMLWGWLNVALLVWALRHVRELLPANWSPPTIAAFHALVALAAIRGVWAGQSNTLIFALVAAGAAAVSRGRWWLAGWLLAAPVFVKVWPLAAAMLFVACWPRQLSWRFLVALLVLSALPFLTRPPEIVWDHYADWIAGLIGPMQERHIYRDAWTIAELIHSPVWPRGYTLLQLAAAAIALGLCLRARVAPTGGLSAPAFVLCAWTVWQLVFGPGVERNTLCLIAPLTAWALIASWQTGRGRGLSTTAYVLTVAFSFGALERALVGALPIVLAALPLGVLCFGAWLVGVQPSGCRALPRVSQCSARHAKA